MVTLIHVGLPHVSRIGARCLGAAVGLLADWVTGEPPNQLHPVAWFGTVMAHVESALWADRRANGVAYMAIGTGLGAVFGRLIGSTAATVTIAVAGRQLRSTADQIGQAARSGDLERARMELPALVGRDPTELDASGIAAAVIESVAENTVDAVIAPVFWAVIAGAPGAAAYRAINTMDAMVGRRNARYRYFGWAAARIDDAANYVPARIFAGLVAAQSPAQTTRILATVRRDAPAHPSPNAGVAETAMAAALQCELGGPLRYGSDVEDRPALGSGPRPSPGDIAAAVRIAHRAEASTVGLLVIARLAATLQRRARADGLDA